MGTSIPEEIIPNQNSDGYSNSVIADTDGSGGINLVDNNLFMGRDPIAGNTYVQSGFRFSTIPVPNAANIISARLTIFSFVNILTDNVEWKITAEKVPDPGAWADGHRPGTGGAPGRGPETTAKVDWDISTPWAISTAYFTPNIKTIVQELVDDVGWASGQSMAFIIRNDGTHLGHRRAWAFGGPGPSRLNITYGPESDGQIMRISIT